MRIVVINHVTLDGIMQGPGRPDEDTRDGVTHGGWAEPNTDDDLAVLPSSCLNASCGSSFGDCLEVGVFLPDYRAPHRLTVLV